MMKNIIIAFGVFGVVLLSSCGGSHKNVLKEVDSLLIVLTSIDTTIASFDLDTTRSHYSEIKKNVDFFTENLPTIPQDSLERVSVSEYANIFKGFRKFFKTLGALKNDALFSRNQLESLKKDLTEGNMTGKESRQYIEEEKQAIDKLYGDVQAAKEKYNLHCTEISVPEPVVLALIERLKNQKAGNK